jgi:hypothetical protein
MTENSPQISNINTNVSKNQDESIDIDTEHPQLYKLMKNSVILNMLYEHVIKNVGNHLEKLNFFANKTNMKYIAFVICLLLATSLLGLMSYFLFYVMFFFSSLKCILWLFEGYKPSNINYNDDDEEIEYHYVSETSSVDVLEYYVILIFIVLVMHPLAYIPIPFISTFVYGSSVMIGIAAMTSKLHRQKICLFVRDLFTNKNSRDNDGNYVPGYEGEFHKFLQTLCYVMECINLSTFHITHRPKVTFNKLSSVKSIVHGLQLVTRDVKINELILTTKSKPESSTDIRDNKPDNKSQLSIKTNNSDEIFDEDL